jgi:5-methylcytosine-specific restriction endonuclease McrA
VTNRACICGPSIASGIGAATGCRQARVPGSYGAFYQHNREILLRKAGCRPGTGVGGVCEICGKPGIPGDPLQADHIVAVADGGGDELANLRAIHKSEHARRTGQQGAKAKRRRQKGE